MEQKCEKPSRVPVIMLIVWSLFVISVTVLCKSSRHYAETYKGDGQQLMSLALLVLPFYAQLLSTPIAAIILFINFFSPKKKGRSTLTLALPLIVFFVTLATCMLVDGQAIIRYFTTGKYPFW